MKIAIVYNRESQAVINLFGQLNREKYGLHTIKSIKDALVAGGHQVKTFEGDKNIIEQLEKFMPSVVSGERPGLVFNLSYGIQGKGRYMHIPGILEMLGIPYVGSGPDTHAIALDKVVTKLILIQKGIPTPKFTVMYKPDATITGDLNYPMIVKPKDEAVSFGLKIVNNEVELRDGVRNIYENFNSPTLVEEYISGREFNVALLGNHPPEALPPVELTFGDGPQIYTYEDKKSLSGREVQKTCPANLSEELTEKIQQLAIDTFNALGCYDSARVDFRMNEKGDLYVLEVNSMASLGANGSFVFAAEKIGLDYNALMNKLVEVASERYFGPLVFDHLSDNASSHSVHLFNHITNNRDKIEKELKMWTNLPSWTEDQVGLKTVTRKLEERMKKLGLKEVLEYTNRQSVWTWETKGGLKDGTLLVLPIDIPGDRSGFPVPFNIDQEWIYGEGIASSRGGLVTLLSALTGLKDIKSLANKKVGVLIYADEGKGMRYSYDTLRKVANDVKEVMVLQPGFKDGKVVDQRRGSKRFSIIVEGDSLRVGNHSNKIDVMSYFLEKAEKLKALNGMDSKLSVVVQDIHSERYSVLLPHRVRASVYMTFLDENKAKEAETQIRALFKSTTRGIQCYVEKLTERPLYKRRRNNPLIEQLSGISAELNIPFGIESSLLPSAAGEIHNNIPILCGLAPASKGLYTPNEAIHRGELIQKSLLLGMYLLKNQD